MKTDRTGWTIIGQGLAGTCLAWVLWERGEKFHLLDHGAAGSSWIAAGMINPITGKNFEPSWRIAEFLPDALEFYAAVEKRIGCQLWHPFPVLRLAESEKEWRKISSKLASPDVSPWVAREVEAPNGWVGAVELRGGGRLDVQAFLKRSREFFKQHGHYQLAGSATVEIFCTGALGLLGGDYGPHRCAKGEILTLQAKGWDESRIRIGAGGWSVPQGGGIFKVGSTYEWNELDQVPTEKGRMRVEEIARRLGGHNFEITDHEADVRPIMRRSQPLIGPLAGGGWMFNGLGSKGSLYAPGIAAMLGRWLVDDLEPSPDVDFRVFLEQNSRDDSC